MRDPMCASDVYLQATFTPQCICKGHVDGYAPACHRNVVTLCLGLSFDAIRSPHMAVGVRSNNKIGEHAVVNKNVVAHSHTPRGWQVSCKALTSESCSIRGVGRVVGNIRGCR